MTTRRRTPALQRRKPAVFALTRGGALLARRIAAELPADLHLLRGVPDPFAETSDGPAATRFERTSVALQAEFRAGTPLICVMATGIVIRSLASCLADKRSDPSVVVIDEAGRYVIPLLGGHLGGANELAAELARILGAEAVQTTSSDVQGLLGPDLLARRLRAQVLEPEHLTAAASSLVNGRGLRLVFDREELGAAVAGELEALEGYSSWIPGKQLSPAAEEADVEGRGEDGSVTLILGCRRHLLQELLQPANADAQEAVSPSVRVGDWEAQTLVHLVPRWIWAGVGCRRGTASETIAAAVREALEESALFPQSLAGLASVSAKADEEGLHQAAAQLGVPLRFAEPDVLEAVVRKHGLAGREFVREQVGVGAVAEPAAVWAAEGLWSDGGEVRLVAGKRIKGKVTVALAVGVPAVFDAEGEVGG
ncbi:MAG: cobalt-precorrin 5A hydrolase [Thermoleophilia bacterium]